MKFIIAAVDGSLRSCTVDANDAGQAFEAMARQLNYPSFAALSADLGYTAGDFAVCEIRVAPSREYDEAADRANVNRQKDNLLHTAFRALRRLAHTEQRR